MAFDTTSHYLEGDIFHQNVIFTKNVVNFSGKIIYYNTYDPRQFF